MSSPTATTRSSARTYATSASRTTASRARRRAITTGSRRTSSARSTSKGYLIEQTTLGAFSPSTGRTLPDRYIEGTCPICGYPEARGDQCDNCGNQLDPIDLIDPRSIIDGSTPEFRETKHLFLDLPAFAEQLEEWLSAQDAWRPNVKNFSLGLVRELKPRAMTRDIDWGVPVPVDGYPEETKRIYVWFDAVIGYLSASVEWAHNRGTPDAWREWWQNPDSRHFYFMGKDNIVFHTVIWPAMLLGYGDGRRARRRQGRPAPADERRRERVPDDGGQEGEHEPQPRDLGPRLPRAATTPTRCATTSPPAGPRRRTPTSPGRSSCGATTTSCSRTGATSSTARS